MSYQVVYSRRATSHLVRLEKYIAGRGSPENAKHFVAAIIAQCDGLALAPLQGTARDEIEPGLRTIGFRHRVTIAFRVRPGVILIAAILYGGRSLERAFGVEPR